MITHDDLLKYFDSQIAIAEPITSAMLDEMREGRRELAINLGLEDKLPASLAELDGREGQTLYYYMLEEFIDGTPPTMNVKILKVWSVDIDQLSNLTFVNMSGKFPRFKDTQ